jgi:DNA-binding transcriptional MerR regulator
MEMGSGQVAGGTSGGDGQSPAECLLSIGDIAREFGVSLRALRFYEDRGLLHPRRRGTTRLYSERDRSHLQMILKGKQLGFTLSEIREILCARGDVMNGWDLELNLHPDQIVSQIRHLERQRADLESALNELKKAHQRASTGHEELNAA